MVNAEGTACEEMVGTQNILFPVEYKVVPYWEVEALPAAFKTALTSFRDNFYQASIDCGKKQGGALCV